MLFFSLTYITPNSHLSRYGFILIESAFNEPICTSLEPVIVEELELIYPLPPILEFVLPLYLIHSTLPELPDEPLLPDVPLEPEEPDVPFVPSLIFLTKSASVIPV